ncbi:unnamed protein product [Gongylonema pulchrum]|uniref:AAA_12 domain-containing protein n=1 Tax=Gongylonema pulchrum TaxID=637853 RepID=A0A183ELN5_9BILA|nr:unnamed protein product [Gongylonema pulchrum]
MSDRGVIPIVCLTQTFRSHPHLTNFLSHAAYNDELISPLATIQRTFLISSDFPLPAQHVPLLLLHTRDTNFQDICRSQYNPE